MCKPVNIGTVSRIQIYIVSNLRKCCTLYIHYIDDTVYRFNEARHIQIVLPIHYTNRRKRFNDRAVPSQGSSLSGPTHFIMTQFPVNNVTWQSGEVQTNMRLGPHDIELPFVDMSTPDMHRGMLLLMLSLLLDIIMLSSGAPWVSGLPIGPRQGWIISIGPSSGIVGFLQWGWEGLTGRW